MSGFLRIYLCGGHSTGKTTLLKDLQNYLHVQSHANVGRGVLQQLGLNRDQVDYQNFPDQFEKLQEEILKQLLKIDDECVSNSIDYICDRGIDPLIYASMYLGEEVGDRLLKLFFVQEFVERLRNSLLFVILPHQECLVDDGVRMHPTMKELELFTDKMLSSLKELKIPYKVIDVLDLLDRRKQVLAEILKIKPQIVKE